MGCHTIIVVPKITSQVLLTKGTTVTVNTGDVSSLVSPFSAGSAIQAYDVVAAFGSVVVPATVTDPLHLNNVIGIALNAANIGDSVNVVSQGRVTFASWSWDDTLPLFLSHIPGQLIQDDNEPGINGALFTVQLGHVRDTDTVDINIQQAIQYI